MMNTIFLISIPLLFFFFLFRMIVNRSSSKELPLPPGPYPWPIIGNTFHIGKHNSHIRLAKMAQLHGPLMSLRSGQHIVIVGSTAEAAYEILKTHDEALSGRNVSRFLEPTTQNSCLVFTQKCDDGWRHLRNMYQTELFANKALETRAKMRESKVTEMVKYLGSKTGEKVMIKDVLSAMILNVISNTCLSSDVVDFEGNGIGAGVVKSLIRLGVLGGMPLLSDMYPRLGRWSLRKWYKDAMDIIDLKLGGVWKDILERKRNRSSDVVSSSGVKDFTDVLIEKGYDNHQINLMMQEVVSAGITGTSSTIEWFIIELLRSPQDMQKAVDEIKNKVNGNIVKDSDLVNLVFLEACYKETLRLHPPGPILLPHQALKTCQVMGYKIPKNSQLFVNVWAINRDPKIWDDPLIFKPERFLLGSTKRFSYKGGKDFEYIPFGSGRRMCPGEPFASKTILLIVASLILNFNWFLPDDLNPVNINMEEEMDIAMHKKEALHLIFNVRGQ